MTRARIATDATAEYRVYLVICGLEAEVTTDRLGLSPARTVKAGDILRSGLRAPDHSWEIRRHFPVATTSLSESIRSLLESIPQWLELVSIASEASVFIEIAIYGFQKMQPDLVFDEDVVERLGSIRASVQLSLY